MIPYALIGLIFLAVCGTIGFAKGNDRRARALFAGVWVWGGLLIYLLLGFVVLLGIAVSCGFSSGPPSTCHREIEPVYEVLTEWQSGVGALIGLLGLAWANFFKVAHDSA